ncbi:MAG: hypothetical protein K8R58_07365, partial [Bacteroidales bacterium]|nr:hypothetical protein [Bacteroidales bacterium]
MFKKYCTLGLILFFVSISFSLFSQTFEKIYRTQLDDFSNDAIKLSDNSFVISINSGNFEFDDYNGKLIKLSEEGDIIDSVLICISNEYKLSYISNLFNLNDSIIIAVGICKNLNTNNYQVLLAKFNTQLELLFDTIVGNEIPIEYYFDHILTHDNKLVSIGTKQPEYDHFIYVRDLNGNLLNYKYLIDTIYISTALTIKELVNENKYHLYIFEALKPIWVINKETLEIDTVYHYPDRFRSQDAVIGTDSLSYYVSGKSYNPDYNMRTPAFIKVSNSGEIIEFNEYLANPDTNSYCQINCFDHYNNKIFLAATYNFTQAPPFYFREEPRWIWINKLNLDGSIIWQRFYKGEVNYMHYTVLATSDGGALIISTKYDWNDPIPEQRDVHILKIDSTGWYNGINTGITPYETPKQILVYPNPVKNEVKFV